MPSAIIDSLRHVARICSPLVTLRIADNHLRKHLPADSSVLAELAAVAAEMPNGLDSLVQQVLVANGDPAPKIILSPFSKNRDSGVCTVPLEDKVPEIVANFPKAIAGYRPGVVRVPISPKDFVSCVVQLTEGDALHGSYRARQAGETPRKEIRAAAGLTPMPLTGVEVVLYHNSVLALGNENSDLTADWEIITFLTKVTEGEQPMVPETLMANHFVDSGGTPTEMSDTDFVNALRASYQFWRDKAILG